MNLIKYPLYFTHWIAHKRTDMALSRLYSSRTHCFVFNKEDPLSDCDKHYLTMYLCEFAQELQYMLLGRGAFVRGLVTRGQFEDTGSIPNSTYKNIRSFWGKALIHAYRLTTSIKGLGLFVDEHVKPHMRVFEVHPYDDHNHVWFVDTTSLQKQSFGYLANEEEPSTAIDNVRSSGLEHILAYDLLLLRRLFKSAHDYTLAPTVRTKYLTTWDIYRHKYRTLCRALEDTDFDLKELLGHNWERAVVQIRRSRGFFG